MSEWQPIETAPKDGTQVILYFPGLARPIYTGYFWDHEEWEYGKKKRHTRKWMFGSAYWTTDEKPTHWMPFPPAPE